MHFHILKTHRNWEDWLSILLGLVIGLSPWLAADMGSQNMMLNAIIVGALVFFRGELEAANLHRWQEGGEIVLGSWLAASPFIFGYSTSGALRFWHFALGATVVVLAAIKLWQDWNLSDKELAEHEL